LSPSPEKEKKRIEDGGGLRDPKRERKNPLPPPELRRMASKKQKLSWK